MPEALLDALAPAFAAREALLIRDGFAPIRTEWLVRAAHLGGTITARTMADAVTGRFDGIDGTGTLLLGTPEGPRRIAAAEIFFGAEPCS